MKKARTSAEARAKPGLKLLTPLEYAKVDLRNLSNRQRWEWLFSPERNRWKLIK